MSDKKPHTFKFSVRIKGDCDQVFMEGLDPGEIGYAEVVYQLTEEDRNHGMFHKALLDKQAELLEEMVEVVITQVD